MPRSLASSPSLTSPTSPPAKATRDDVEACANERLHRTLTGVVTAVPVLSLGLVAWQAWDSFLHWSDIAVFLVLYVATGLGVTVGYHRLFTHRSFKTTRAVRATLGALGSAALEGPLIAWAADHRKHHAFTDVEGDPHSPHVGHGDGVRGILKGLLHAHIGWLFLHDQRAAKERYAPDLLADPTVRFIERTFLLWVALGLLVPFALGFLLTRTLSGALTGLLWGGAVRMLVLHHTTYSINSLCHFFGRRRFDTGDESRNLAWLAPLSFGEAWHNNHHAFPTSAEHGLSRVERLLDPTALVIRALERLGLASDVVRVSPQRQARKLAR